MGIKGVHGWEKGWDPLANRADSKEVPVLLLRTSFWVDADRHRGKELTCTICGRSEPADNIKVTFNDDIKAKHPHPEDQRITVTQGESSMPLDRCT